MPHKMITLLAALALSAGSPLAHGQSVEQTGAIGVPMSVVYQGIFASLFPSGKANSTTGDSTRGNVISFFRTSIGLSEQASAALFSYVRDSLSRQREFSRSRVERMCATRADIETKGELADVFVSIYEGLDRMEERQWGAGLLEILDEENAAILSKYGMKRRARMGTYIPADPHEAFERTPETLNEILTRICEVQLAQ